MTIGLLMSHLLQVVCVKEKFILVQLIYKISKVLLYPFSVLIHSDLTFMSKCTTPNLLNRTILNG